MTGLGITLFTDEMISPRLAEALRRQGYDARSCHELNRINRQLSDDEQLEYAAREGRALLTENAKDFVILDAAWKSSGRVHAGIIVFSTMPFSALLRRVTAYLTVTDAETQHDTLLWL